MKLWVLLLLPQMLWAQRPDLAGYKMTPASAILFRYKGCFLNKRCYEAQRHIRTEIPPATLTVNGATTYFLVDGRKTYSWTIDKSLEEPPVIDLKKAKSGPVLATLPYILSEDYEATKPLQDWKRNYYGIYSAQEMEAADKFTIGFCHGENKNEIMSKDCAASTAAERFQNTVQANIPIDCGNNDTWSGGQPYHDGWDAYNGVLSAVWKPNQISSVAEPSFNNDIGPIAWPSMAYMNAEGVKATNGLRHPSSLIYNDTVYVFYVEAGVYKGWTPSEEGRMGGVKVVRAACQDARNSAAYEAYYEDPKEGAGAWNPSLPAGFTKETMLEYANVRGPKTTDLTRDNNRTADPVRFSVAKVRNKDYFISVEEYHNWDSPAYYLAIRHSFNLTDWSAPRIIYSAPSWEAFLYHYPLLLNKSGTSNTEIDEDGFYVSGTGNRWNNKVNLFQLRQ